VIQIRNLAAQNHLSQREIGKMFGVYQPAISAIITRRRWSHIP
jgi:predicted XRE-type DNA-binding protein